MFLKGKGLEEYKGFSQRLVRVSIDRGITTTRALGKALHDNEECRRIIHLRTKQKKDPSSPSEPVLSIMRNIQKHLNETDAYNVPSAYMYAYSIVLDCSIDYLYGKTEIMSPSLDVRDVCNKVGLSEAAVTKLMEYHNNDDGEGFSVTSWWSEILAGSTLESIPIAWYMYASRIVEILDLDKRIAASEKSSKKEMTDPIMKYLLDDDNQKTLRLVHKDKEDSILGAHHKMITLVDNALSQYADEWAEKQHPGFDEMYYHKEINKRKIINSVLKK